MPKKNQTDTKVSSTKHIPVMKAEVLDYIRPKLGQSYLDLTAGYGGHAEAVLNLTNSPNKAVLVDRDDQAVAVLKDRFAEVGAKIIHQDFLKATQYLTSEGMHFDMILADLGLSSPHLEEADRGFSIKKPAVLDMRMDRRQELTAQVIVNTWPEEKLATIIRDYGQEPKARRIAQRIVRNRPIDTTDKLAAIISPIWPGRSKIHPASRTFQALRIVVNDEIGQLEQTLQQLPDLMAPGGRLVIISFHSLEDRLVKRFISEQSSEGYDTQLRALTKKPLTPSRNEIVFNPRARSAKLRAVVKIKTKKKGLSVKLNVY
ncbi:16S rRNA (cytosine(1402)-N(4))-methyltransferase RsmH [Candidatus Saccharibacteria bacterium]|nr:16S rRNA (cytosine(1402)-N(4))-methyltransferase RsmH [Candidatus Saccharibacteria bacterium]